MTAPAAVGPVFGVAAACYPIPKPEPPYLVPAHAGTIAQWLVLAPQQHPIWPHYILWACHLRDVPGQTAPLVRRDDFVTHDLMMAALSPKYAPWDVPKALWVQEGNRLEDPENKGAALSPILVPLNVSVQVTLGDDTQCVELLRLTASALAHGLLVCEPRKFQNGRTIWEIVIHKVAEMLAAGERPVDEDMKFTPGPPSLRIVPPSMN